MTPGQADRITFHHREKGCVIVEWKKKVHHDSNNRECQTHQTRMCRCGWEFGAHPIPYDGTEVQVVEQGIEIE